MPQWRRCERSETVPLTCSTGGVANIYSPHLRKLYATPNNHLEDQQLQRRTKIQPHGILPGKSNNLGGFHENGWRTVIIRGVPAQAETVLLQTCEILGITASSVNNLSYPFFSGRLVVSLCFAVVSNRSLPPSWMPLSKMFVWLANVVSPSILMTQDDVDRAPVSITTPEGAENMCCV